jgi:hypothetical protein
MHAVAKKPQRSFTLLYFTLLYVPLPRIERVSNPRKPQKAPASAGAFARLKGVDTVTGHRAGGLGNMVSGEECGREGRGLRSVQWGLWTAQAPWSSFVTRFGISSAGRTLDGLINMESCRRIDWACLWV